MCSITVVIVCIVINLKYTFLETQKPSSSREISHMKFTSWKERTMPNVALFVGFVTATREARKKYGDSKAPAIVHCRLVVFPRTYIPPAVPHSECRGICSKEMTPIVCARY